MTTVVKRPILSASILESICLLLADTNTGLTGSQLAKLLADSQIPDVDPSLSKWKRLFNAFVSWQNAHQCSNYILKFIQQAINPVSYLGRESLFEDRRHKINQILSFAALELTDTGKFKIVERSETITQAEQRANRLKHKLESRNTHAYIFMYCKPELLVDNCFHAVFEATKSVADRIRELTGLILDGNALVDKAFARELPLITINPLLTESERSEHTGLANLIKGMFGLIRNPTAHDPKLKFDINEEEALDKLTTISLIHKLLDKAILSY
jgi:uncharacterized protein (TIGR02391 family)